MPKKEKDPMSATGISIPTLAPALAFLLALSQYKRKGHTFLYMAPICCTANQNHRKKGVIIISFIDEIRVISWNIWKQIYI